MLTYAESSDLMNDAAFRGRVKVACLHFANYIFGEANTVPAHNTRLKWAQKTVEMPDTVTTEVTPPTVMDDAVQAAGAAITDTALQGSVETTVNKLL
jgi:hypothetical protein